MEFFLTTVLKLLPFLRVTILIAFTSMALGLIFGTLLAAMKMCRIKIFKTIANLFTTFIRCTPVIVLIFLAYYGLPVLFGLAGIDINGVSKIVFSIIALTMYASGTLSEIIRPAYLSVDKGQMEAALMSALTPAQAIRLIILPQVVYVALPNFGNMIIALIQESSLAYLIGVVDVMGQAKIIDNMSYGAHIIEVYFAVSLLYWLLSLVTGKCVDLLSGKMGKVLGLFGHTNNIADYICGSGDWYSPCIFYCPCKNKKSATAGSVFNIVSVIYERYTDDCTDLSCL